MRAVRRKNRRNHVARGACVVDPEPSAWVGQVSNLLAGLQPALLRLVSGVAA